MAETLPGHDGPQPNTVMMTQDLQIEIQVVNDFKLKNNRFINIIANNPKGVLQKLNSKVRSKLNSINRLPLETSFAVPWDNAEFPKIPTHTTQDVNSEISVRVDGAVPTTANL